MAFDGRGGGPAALLDLAHRLLDANKTKVGAVTTGDTGRGRTLWAYGRSDRTGDHRDSIEAHLTIVFAALAVSRWIEARTDWSIRKFVKTARRYRTAEIQAGRQTITAADPLPEDLRQALEAIIRARSGAH